MLKLYGIKVTPPDDSIPFVEWVSIYADRVDGRVSRIKAVEGANQSRFEPIDSPVIIWDFGWYKTDNPNILVKINDHDLKRAHGWMYELNGKTRTDMFKDAHWYLNGDPVCANLPKIIQKVKP